MRVEEFPVGAKLAPKKLYFLNNFNVPVAYVEVDDDRFPRAFLEYHSD